MSTCMSSSGSMSDDRYLVGSFPPESRPDGRLDYLYHLLDLMEYTPSEEGGNDIPVNGSAVDGGLDKDRPLRVIDM